MLIYENKLIGADVSSAEIGGVMHGLDRADATLEKIYDQTTTEDVGKAGVTKDELVSDVRTEK